LEELSKNEAARRIPSIKARIAETCRAWNRDDAIIGLLCLEDALDSLNQVVGASLLHEAADPRTSDLEKTALLGSIQNRFFLIHEALSLILSLGKEESSRLDGIPIIEFAVNGDKHLVARTLKLVPGDSFWIGTLRLLGHIEIGWGLKIKQALRTVREEIVLGLWDLLQLISTYHLYNTAVRLDTSLSIKDGEVVPRINYSPSTTPESLLALEGKSTRSELQSSRLSADWSSPAFSEASKRGLDAVAFGLDSHIGRSTLEVEHIEFFNAYRGFAGFDRVFLQEFGCSIDTFEKVTLSLMRLSRPKVHCVYKGRYDKIVQRLRRDTSLPKSEIENVIRRLLWKPGLSAFYFPILSLKNERVFSLFRILGITMLIVEQCFDLAYDNSPKGKLFEDRCRNVLSDAGFGVLPGRFIVNDQVLSNEDSRRLWGKVKSSTDFDVLGSKQQFLISLECKERTRPVPSSVRSRRRTRLENSFAKYHEELMLKTAWLKDNLDRLAASPSLRTSAHDGPKFVLPLLVCNFAGPSEGPLQFLTFKELSYFARNFDSNSMPSNNLIKIPVDPNRWSLVSCIPITELLT
jgi:hypothetical protein